MIISKRLSFFILTVLILCKGAYANCNASLPGSSAGVFSANSINFSGVNREYCTYEPDDYATADSVAAIFYLHGGNQSAINMYADPQGNKDPLRYADLNDFVAVFPQGLDKDGNHSGTNLLWGDSVNVQYLDTLITEVQSQFPKIDPAHIFLVGFSGGAKLIYRFVEDVSTVNSIRGIATVAGTIGGKAIDPPDSDWIIHDPSVTGGTPVSALLLQGGLDPRLPINGGIDSYSISKNVISFDSKVDIWRALTDAFTPVPAIVKQTEGLLREELPPGLIRKVEPLNTSNLKIKPPMRQLAKGKGLPANVHLDIYRSTGFQYYVVKVVDDDLAHMWPEWDLDLLIVDFFNRL